MKVLSGIRPSGKLHLGNYIGAILPAMNYDADILIAEYHAIGGDAVELYDELEKYINTSNNILYQSEEFDPELYFKLLSVTPTGLLNHMPQYKEKEKTAHMFTYPVLMAHDLVGYDKVIVGLDQKPHIEFAKDILHKIGEECPTPIYDGGKVMDLRNPTQKMSKSNPNSCLFLSDPIEINARKITKAITDEAGRANLEFIHHSLDLGEIPELNKDLKNDIIEFLNYLGK